MLTSSKNSSSANKMAYNTLSLELEEELDRRLESQSTVAVSMIEGITGGTISSDTLRNSRIRPGDRFGRASGRDNPYADDIYGERVERDREQQYRDTMLRCWAAEVATGACSPLVGFEQWFVREQEQIKTNEEYNGETQIYCQSRSGAASFSCSSARSRSTTPTSPADSRSSTRSRSTPTSAVERLSRGPIMLSLTKNQPVTTTIDAIENHCRDEDHAH
ncbi:unnamed protein product [Amoebophrya sp. A120]|nr:unnamed protein product [Amoebophrya sp. A120]|eukprot:GSA120T00012380001.1